MEDNSAYFVSEDTELTPSEGYITIQGSNGDDMLFGTDKKDNISGRDGDDVISGLKGNDKIQGNKGRDFLFGNEGDDEIEGNEGPDIINGGAGKDTISGGEGDDVLYGGQIVKIADGVLVIEGDGEEDKISGGTGDDIYMFERNHGKDIILDEEGNDVIKFYQHTEKEKIQFHRSEDDSLVITFDGDSTNNSVTVKKYFSDRQFKIEAVEVNGWRLAMAGNVDKLINEMAGFSSACRDYASDIRDTSLANYWAPVIRSTIKNTS